MTDRDFFTDDVREQIRQAIRETLGNEVFFVGSRSPFPNAAREQPSQRLSGKRVDWLVEHIKVVARGNDSSAPAVIDSAQPGDVVIHNHPSGNLNPSNQDVRMASLFGNQGIGFFIVNNEVDRVYVVVEPFLEKEKKSLNIDKMKVLLLPHGEIANVMKEDYEQREEQLDMLEAVSSAFNNSRISLIEAGTGTGKTLAYLIPALYWSLQNDERVVISTNTINLQEQLIDKDLPLLAKALDEDFSYSLVKGMGNYLCLLRADTIGDGLFEMAEEEEVDALTDVLEWSRVTDDGSLSDLNFTPPDSVWDKVSADSDSCLRAGCPYYSKCFFYKSRRKSASSQILVVNHHLLFADLSIKSASDNSEAGVLPPFKRVIFDEAHHLVDAATSHFGMRATKFGIIRILRRLKRKSRKGEAKGLILWMVSLASKLIKHIGEGMLNKVLEKADKILSPSVDVIESYVTDAFDSLYNVALCVSPDASSSLRRPKDTSSSGSLPTGEVNLRVTEHIYFREEWAGIDEKFVALRIRLNELHKEIKSFTHLLIDYEEEVEVAKLMVEFNGVANKLNYYSDVISAFLSKERDGYVRWIEGRQRRGSIISGIGLSPLDISGSLQESLYSCCDTVIMTSATMAVGQ